VIADVTDVGAAARAVEAAVSAAGGIDMLVAAAGVFGASAAIADFDPASWRDVMAVNAEAVAQLLAAAHPCLRLAPNGGRVVVVGSRNVPAPGPGAAVYSASKAAVTQVARVAALEWAGDGIRVHVVHPDAVYDTGLWTPRLLAERAERYGLTVEEYRRRNLLRTEVASSDVAHVVAALLGPAFRAVTGAQVPVDGGSDRVV
jgi:NAD(P)-dependent dehydrogenase (short-subunit alcohol dehydrogenase family)